VSKGKVVQSRMRDKIIESFKLMENNMKKEKEKLLRMFDVEEVYHKNAITEKNEQIIRLNEDKSLMKKKSERSEQQLRDANMVIHKLSADLKLIREGTPETIDNEENSLEIENNNKAGGDASENGHGTAVRGGTGMIPAREESQKRNRTSLDWATIFGKKRKVGKTQEEETKEAPRPGQALKVIGKGCGGGTGAAINTVDQGGKEALGNGALSCKGEFLPPSSMSLDGLSVDALSRYTRCAVKVQKIPQNLLQQCLEDNQCTAV